MQEIVGSKGKHKYTDLKKMCCECRREIFIPISLAAFRQNPIGYICPECSHRSSRGVFF